MRKDDRVRHPDHPAYGKGIVVNANDSEKILVLWVEYGKQYGFYKESELEVIR